MYVHTLRWFAVKYHKEFLLVLDLAFKNLKIGLCEIMYVRDFKSVHKLDFKLYV
jgi:hypothetical protein